MKDQIGNISTFLLNTSLPGNALPPLDGKTLARKKGNCCGRSDSMKKHWHDTRGTLAALVSRRSINNRLRHPVVLFFVKSGFATSLKQSKDTSWRALIVRVPY